MAERPLLSRPHRLLAQLVIIASGSITLGLAPPASGQMLLVPLSSGAARTMVSEAVLHGALLVGSGALPGSLVVIGDRAALAGPLLGSGAALLRAPAGAGCGR